MEEIVGYKKKGRAGGRSVGRPQTKAKRVAGGTMAPLYI